MTLIGKNAQILSYLEPYGFYKYFNEYFLEYPAPFYLFKIFFCHRMPSRLSYSVDKVLSEETKEKMNPKLILSSKYILDRMKVFEACETKKDYLNVYSQFADRVFGDFAELCNKQRWCIKVPGYLYQNIDKIHLIHPNMRFIHIVRDGRDVVASIIKQPWLRAGSNQFDDALRIWLSLEKGDKKSKYIPPQNLLTVKLEEILLNESRVERNM